MDVVIGKQNILRPRLPEKELYVIDMYFRTVDTSTDTEDLPASSVPQRSTQDPHGKPLSGALQFIPALRIYIDQSRKLQSREESIPGTESGIE
jgi:hypothetical protein